MSRYCPPTYPRIRVTARGAPGHPPGEDPVLADLGVPVVARIVLLVVPVASESFSREVRGQLEVAAGKGVERVVSRIVLGHQAEPRASELDAVAQDIAGDPLRQVGEAGGHGHVAETETDVEILGDSPERPRSEERSVLVSQDGEGPGVVGRQPHIAPDDAYRYTSAAVLDTPVGTMQGHYRFVGDDGDAFDVEIPVFSLAVPNAMH